MRSQISASGHIASGMSAGASSPLGIIAGSGTLPAQLSVDAMVALHQRYEDLKDERKQIDFEDVLLASVTMGALER